MHQRTRNNLTHFASIGAHLDLNKPVERKRLLEMLNEEDEQNESLYLNDRSFSDQAAAEREMEDEGLIVL